MKVTKFTNLNQTNTVTNLLNLEDHDLHVKKIVGAKDVTGVHKSLKLHKRSITPDTLEWLKINSSEDDLFYTENYKCKANGNNSVERYAINTNYSKLVKDLEEQGQKLVEPSADNKSSYKTTNINSITHSDIEKHLLNNAIKSLLGNDQKTVLVDIFARNIGDNNGSIKLKHGEIETHTIVLYKLSDKDFVIVDPSNYYFSSHLVNSSKDIGVNFLLPNAKGYKIYSPISEDSTGPQKGQWRDCIDIAAKLAFGFNKNELAQDILKDPTVISLSNSDKIDNNIYYQNKIAVRKKQSSNIDEVFKTQDKIKTNKLLFDKYQDKIIAIKESADTKLQNIFFNDMEENSNFDLANEKEVIGDCFDLNI